MKKINIGQRDISLDIIRSVAIFSVISVHFFLNNGFYTQQVVGVRMYVMTIMRTSFMVCVPLFLLLSGYLMSQKKLSTRYYLGIIKVLVIYIFASVACLLYKAKFLGMPFTLKTLILSTLNFTGANYSWYVEMYVGLFLLIPFLNILYEHINEQKEKKLLVLTLFVLTTLPSVCNLFFKMLPSWWNGIYPITYYFIGCYIREYDVPIKKGTNSLLFVLCVMLFGTSDFLRSYGGEFKWGMFNDWGGYQTVILAGLLFVFLRHLRGEKLPVSIQWIFWKISELSYGAFLVSYIFDSFAYQKLLDAVPVMTARLEYYIIIVPFVFVSSLLLSFCFHSIYNVLWSAVTKLLLSNHKKSLVLR